MLIPKSIFNVSRLCGGKGPFALNHVKVARTKDGPLAVATNEASLLIAAWRETDAKAFPKCGGSTKQVKGFERLVPAKTWDEVSGMIPKQTPLPAALLDETKKGETLFCTHGFNTPKTLRVLPPAKDTVFPALARLRQTIPTYADNEVTKIAVDPRRLAGLLNAIAACTANNEPVVILEIPKDGERAMVIKDCQNSYMQALGVLMPVIPENVRFTALLDALAAEVPHGKKPEPKVAKTGGGSAAPARPHCNG